MRSSDEHDVDGTRSQRAGLESGADVVGRPRVDADQRQAFEAVPRDALGAGAEAGPTLGLVLRDLAPVLGELGDAAVPVEAEQEHVVEAVTQ